MSLEPGSTLGPYQIVQELTRGETAVSYKAHDPRLDRFVAVKVVQPIFAEQVGFAARFEREAIAVAKLRHPHILKVHDYGNEHGIAYMVTDFVEGGSLVARLGVPVPPAEVASLMSGIGSALDYAHQHDVLHRRIKPDNILLWEDGTAVLSDFGLARHADTSVAMTGASEVLASLVYMAPELIEGAPAGPVTDRYALAVVAYELLTGVALFNPSRPASELVALAAKPLEPARSVNPSLNPAIERVLVRALDRRPDQRYPSASAFAAALDAANTRGDGIEVLTTVFPSPLVSTEPPLHTPTTPAQTDPETSTADAPTMQVQLPTPLVAIPEIPHPHLADAPDKHVDGATTMTTLLPHPAVVPDSTPVTPLPVADAAESTMQATAQHLATEPRESAVDTNEPTMLTTTPSLATVESPPTPVADNLAPTMTTDLHPHRSAALETVATSVQESLAPTLTTTALPQTPLPVETVETPAPVVESPVAHEPPKAPTPSESEMGIVSAPDLDAPEIDAAGGQAELPSADTARDAVATAPPANSPPNTQEGAAVQAPVEAQPTLPTPAQPAAQRARPRFHPAWLVAVAVLAIAVWLVLRMLFSPVFETVAVNAPSVVTTNDPVHVTWRVRHASRVAIEGYAQGIDASSGGYALRASTPVAAKPLVIRAANFWGSAEATTVPVGFLAVTPTPVPTAAGAPTPLVASAATPILAPVAMTTAFSSPPTPGAPLPTRAPTVVPTEAVAPAATPDAATAWIATSNSLNAVWGHDWQATLTILDAFVQKYPTYQPADDKLYAALISYGDQLAQQGDVSGAETQYQRAKALVPDRPEADAALAALTPTPVPQPQGPKPVRPAPPRPPVTKPVYIPGE
jgi:serine/threonine-protein kinase